MVWRPTNSLPDLVNATTSLFSSSFSMLLKINFPPDIITPSGFAPVPVQMDPETLSVKPPPLMAAMALLSLAISLVS